MQNLANEIITDAGKKWFDKTINDINAMLEKGTIRQGFCICRLINNGISTFEDLTKEYAAVMSKKSNKPAAVREAIKTTYIMCIMQSVNTNKNKPIDEALDINEKEFIEEEYGELGISKIQHVAG